MKISYWEYSLYRKKSNQNPYMIKKPDVNGYFIKTIKISTISTTGIISILIFFNDFNKITISHSWFLFIMYGFGYFHFYTNCIPIVIFSTISFSISMHFTDNT